jgi:hypothetical protein
MQFLLEEFIVGTFYGSNTILSTRTHVVDLFLSGIGISVGDSNNNDELVRSSLDL